MEAVLTIAGSDSSGGAGIQADVKTIEAMGLFAECAVTALTAQNTLGVHGVLDVDPAFVEQQIDVVFDDIRPDAVKVGMVSSPAIVEAISRALVRNGARHVVVDPVMVATSGSALIEGGAVDALVRLLFPLAEVITPNLPEAEALSGIAIADEADAERAARAIAERCRVAAEAFPGGAPGPAPAVLVKGGHGLGGPRAADDLLLACDGRATWLRGARVDNPNAHGTGCTLSSAIAVNLARGLGVERAVRGAKGYVTGALEAGLDLGRGSGPLDHMWAYRPTLIQA
ncbi:bifunctional hydroxymethylpyrimidine kinase/phosphomethylpyrimidine kinase [Adlercreutzia faecimuris]|uniref:Bifunctional hydroxymethylpyrimidine kinase/phosphomethylpyrimidine kinase n=1 Tax=Adlercreutzia faecimuris TaxID=2897341 RepID=A0ABS9WGP4_9ACTN|nr:bifunctional hydroxymethylpyrimidine kinase/phosphomethylpyrimidine kinase [Adlercreutzia sp. JBNU-10]MCI2241755.1 bifunctional hydroxymethylpyrimidine kinase/phosphomethylpyrimidine kinase [Adlercreutzia sp. JBNU-10]